MTYRTMFFQAVIALFCGIFPFTITMAGHASFPQMPIDVEKQLEEAEKLMEEYMASLSPEEQAEFNKAVEELSQRFENMSDEEFEKFFGEMFSEDQMPQPNYFEPETVIAETAIETPQLSPEQLKKVETALAILNDIVKQTNLFTVIVSTSPELPNRINQWTKKGDISNWQEGMDWDKLKLDIENFVQKLYKLQDQDVVTKEYKYLLDLIADATLYDNLIQLRNSLNSLLPAINIPEFGIEKLSSQSKASIKNILKQYTEKFYALDIQKALNTLIEKYDPQAKKLREAEERATKRAMEAAKEPRMPAEPTEAGVEQEIGYDTGYGYGGYDNYYPDYGYSGGYDNGYSPSDGGGYDNQYGTTPTGGGAAGRGGASGGGASGGGAKPEKAGEEKKEEEEKAVQFVPNEEAAEQIGKIKTNLETISSTLKSEDYPQLTDLAAHLNGDQTTQPVNDTLANYILPTVIDKKVTALSDSVKRLTDLSKKMNSKTLTIYQGEVKKAFDKNKKELEKLSKDIAQFKQTEEEEGKEKKKSDEKEEKPTEVNVSRLSKEKRWAYFADEKAKEELGDSELVTKIVHPKSLFDIKKNIDTLLKDVQTFLKKKASAPKKEASHSKKD